jgi:hypothetical protein
MGHLFVDALTKYGTNSWTRQLSRALINGYIDAGNAGRMH